MSYDQNRGAVAIPSEWFEESRTKLSRLGGLDTGWDGFKAEPPSREALKQAGCVLRILHDIEFRPDRIDASAEGGITFAFLAGNRYADIECFNSGEILAVTSDRISEPTVWEVTSTESAIQAASERLKVYVRRSPTGADVPKWPPAGSRFDIMVSLSGQPMDMHARCYAI